MSMHRFRLKIIKLILAVVLFVSEFCFYSCAVYAEESNDLSEYKNFGEYIVSQNFTIEEMIKQYRYLNGGDGVHGFAAEEGNNLLDILSGKNAKVIGYDNSTNGADRVIHYRDGSVAYIQDKYYSNANETVNACFDEVGFFKYYANGKPMQIEVPKDQYEKAVEIMRRKISEGKVEGVTDPDNATSLIKKGHYTYKQAENLTKAGNIDSLIYDSVQGCISAVTAFGIGTTLEFAIRMFNGESWEDALKESANNGIKTAEKAFAITVISLQLLKTDAASVFKPASETIINKFGTSFAECLTGSIGKNVPISDVTKTAVKILQSEALISSVTILVLTAPDIIKMMENKISAKQLVKNFAVSVIAVSASAVGNVVGKVVGSQIAPGIGTVIGGVAGGILLGAVAGYGANYVLGLFVEDDADEMIGIIDKEFYNLSNEYLINSNEAEIIGNKISETLEDGEIIFEMYASENRNEYAKQLLKPLFEETINQREKIFLPTSEQMRYELMNQYEGIVFIH